MTVPSITFLPFIMAAVGYLCWVVFVSVPGHMRDVLSWQLAAVRDAANDEIRSGAVTTDAATAVRTVELAMSYARQITAHGVLVRIGALYTADATTVTTAINDRVAMALERGRAGVPRPITADEGPHMTAFIHAVLRYLLHGSPLGWLISAVAWVTRPRGDWMLRRLDVAVRQAAAATFSQPLNPHVRTA